MDGDGVSGPGALMIDDADGDSLSNVKVSDADLEQLILRVMSPCFTMPKRLLQ
jgi:hypothetical protein